MRNRRLPLQEASERTAGGRGGAHRADGERIRRGEACFRKRNTIETRFLEAKELRIINREDGVITCMTVVTTELKVASL